VDLRRDGVDAKGAVVVGGVAGQRREIVKDPDPVIGIAVGDVARDLASATEANQAAVTVVEQVVALQRVAGSTVHKPVAAVLGRGVARDTYAEHVHGS
jgi:hypothetical protein